jgi:hypothetical protein
VEEDIDRGLGRSRTWLLPFQFLPSPSLLLSLPSQPSLARQQQVSTNLYVVVGLPRCVGLPALPRHANEEGGSLGRTERRHAAQRYPAVSPAAGARRPFSIRCCPAHTAAPVGFMLARVHRGWPACLPNSAAGVLACT